jgi:hypothetical protein
MGLRRCSSGVAAGQDLVSFAILMPRTTESGEFDRRGRRLPVIEYPLLLKLGDTQ